MALHQVTDRHSITAMKSFLTENNLPSGDLNLENNYFSLPIVTKMDA